MKKLIIVPLLLLAGCDYAYRYECQDPANFNKQECKPPQCEYEGECSGWLVGQKDPVPSAEQHTDVDGDVLEPVTVTEEAPVEEEQAESEHE